MSEVEQINSKISYLKDQIASLQESLKAREMLFNLITNDLSDLITIHNQTGICVYVSKSVENLTGFQPEEYVLRDLESYFHPDDSAEVELLLEKCKHNKYAAKLRLLKKDGQWYWVECIAQSLYDENGVALGVRTSSRDISNFINVAKDQEKALNKQKELADMQSKFVTIASHEFRTPLTIIQSSAELLKYYFEKMEYEIPKSIQKNFDRIIKEVEAMNQLMTDILMVAKMEKGVNILNLEKVDFKSFVNQLLIDLFSDRADARYVEFSLEGEEKPVFIDKRLLSHALNNLLNNAFKYSDSNPRLIANFEDKKLKINIHDNGIGIPEEEISRLFNSFYRASNVKSIQGTGLGLVVVKDFIELHGGTVTVKSKLNEGTNFEIILPQ